MANEKQEIITMSKVYQVRKDGALRFPDDVKSLMGVEDNSLLRYKVNLKTKELIIKEIEEKDADSKTS